MKSLLDLLRTDQKAILKHPAQIKVIAMGRRWGKTYMSAMYALTVAEYGGAVAWVAPTYKNSRPLWRQCEQMTAPVAKRIQVHRADREIIFPSQGRIGVYSADNDVSLRGEAFDLVIVDEAAQVKVETYSDVILPTIADRDGRILLISTPKGRNWFYHEHLKAKVTGAAWNAPSSANPSPNIQRAYALARERVSARAFLQEWDAQFIEDGVFFTGVVESATAARQEQGQPGHTYVIGADWARAAGGDYTVFIVLDATTKQMAQIVRLQGQAFDVQRARLADLHERFNRAHIVAEYNAMGMPQVEELQRSGLPVTPFTTTAASKHEIMTALQLVVERCELKLINDLNLIGELQAFEMKQRAGLPHYGAPEGMHDDCVMALALAYHGVTTGHVRVMRNPFYN